MKNLRVVLAALTVAALAFTSACGGGSATDCADGLDNDGDGYIDDGDPGCEINGDFEAPDPDFKACSDAVDNDGDGAIDTEDPGCQDSRDDDEYNEPVAACKNGQDDDEDGLTDFPNDPGCSLTLDDLEGDDCPDGASCPACSNGQDDDGDGDADYPDDRGCNSAADPDEFNADPNICGANVSIQPLPSDGAAAGVFETGEVNELISPDCGGSGEEVVYVYEPTEPRALTITTDFPETTADTVVYVRTDCRMIDTEIACNDDSGLNVSTVQIDRVEPGTYYIIVDSHDNGTASDYRLQVTTYAPLDGSCDPAAPDCAPGLVCRGDAGSETCQPPECRDGNDNDGDGFVDFPDEPGCSDTEDNDETDDCPDGPDCSQCSDTVDNDGDGFIDYPNDPGCATASSDLELDECIPGVLLTQLTDAGTSGTTPPSSDDSDFTPSCHSSTLSTEDEYAYYNTRALSNLTFSTIGSTDNTVLAVRQGDCGNIADEIGCASEDPDGESLTIANPLQNTMYFVFVDGDFSSGLDYVLNVSGTYPNGAACDPADTQFTCDTANGSVCSSGVCAPSLCNNGLDDDGDGDVDAADPGCATIADDTESPDPDPLPACADGIDNDNDSFIDYPDDPGCMMASSDLEIDECIPGVLLTQLTDAGATGTTPPSSEDSDFTSTCDSSTGPTEDEYVYLNTRLLSSLSFSTIGSPDDTVLHVRQGTCGDIASEVACANDSPDGESVTIDDPPEDATYFVFVDGDISSSLDYVLDVWGTWPDGAACDPLDTQFTCETADGSVCSGGVCTPAACNNGVDDDGDGLVDAFDVGCDSIADNTETVDPPACADGVDNDGDGFTDYPDDLGCGMASDDLEVDECIPGVLLTELTDAGTTGQTPPSSEDSDFTPTCHSSSLSTEDEYYYFNTRTLATLSFSTVGSSDNTVLSVRQGDCGDIGDELVCQNDDPDGESVTLASPLVDEVYYVFVDGDFSSSVDYVLDVSGTLPAGAVCDPADTQFVCDGVMTCTGGTCQ